jgi:ComF family protein
MNLLTSYFHDFIGLFFPELCAACGESLLKNEEVVCSSCIYYLPYTSHHLDPENRVARQLWGRFPFVQAGAYVYFQKGNKVQHLMHQLKYNHRPEAGFRMGKLYGLELVRSEGWALPDGIIPVPLHPAKQRKRGYNQSDHIARGLAEGLGIPVITDNLYRTHNTETQTKKARFERYENLQNAFRVRDAACLEGKHLLLVDDVITTGATLEACALRLLALQNVRVSIVALAFAE